MTRAKISRRTFIRLALLGGIGSGLVYIQQKTAEFGILNFLRWSLRGQFKRFSPTAIVGLGKCSSYNEDILSHLSELWKLSEMPDIRGKNILIKPNLLDEIESDLATTHPKVIGAVLDMLEELGASNLVVGDGSAFRRDTNSVAKRCGLLQELSSRNVPFVDLNYDELVPVRTRDGWFENVDFLWLPKQVYEADYIVSVPKLKVHHWAGVTLSIKNLIGVIPGSRYGWPKNIVHMNGMNASILGLYQSLPAVISIVDGIIGMEGNGPLFGKPVEHGLLAMGRDPLAVDIICTQLMGFAIETIPHLSGAAWAGLGQAQKIETRGISPDELQQHYEAAPTI